MEKFTDIFKDLDELNKWRENISPYIPEVELREWVALVGRYGDSHTRYSNRVQFICAFMTILGENIEKLRVKLRVNSELRQLDVVDALSGDEVITNNATNPDTSPSNDAYEPLPYVSSQVAQKGKLAKVRGLYDWKHSVGGQAYNEFLDGFRPLFRVVLREEVNLYEQ
jgi:hypothetical protein